MINDKQQRINEKTNISPRLQEVLFEGPTPGQSLTKDPDERYPWEGPHKYVSLKDTIKGFQAIVNGDYDDLPEQAFYMIGEIEEAKKKADEL